MVAKRVVHDDDEDRSRVVEKIRKLVALATDPSVTEEERRTVAVTACRMIREHDILPRPIQTKKVYGWNRDWPKQYGPKMQATRCGICLYCKKSYEPYDFIRQTFFGHLHDGCLKLWLKVM